MDLRTRMEIEHACTALSHAFAYHLDARNYDGVVAQFAEDGVWIRHTKHLTGRAQILEAMHQRPADQLTRHLTTNVHFITLDLTHATASVYNISYFTRSKSGEPPVNFLPENQMMIEFSDSYINTAEGWKIAKRDTRPVFVPEFMRAAMVGH